MANDSEEERLAQAVLRINGTILGLVFGVISGLLIFIATIWLVVKGGPVVGPHMGLLSQFFIGYSVSFVGSLVGLVYGFISGFVVGYLLAWVYNRIVALKGK